jgi:hypothetical protein
LCGPQGGPSSPLSYFSLLLPGRPQALDFCFSGCCCCVLLCLAVLFASLTCLMPAACTAHITCLTHSLSQYFDCPLLCKRLSCPFVAAFSLCVCLHGPIASCLLIGILEHHPQFFRALHIRFFLRSLSLSLASGCLETWRPALDVCKSPIGSRTATRRRNYLHPSLARSQVKRKCVLERSRTCSSC